MLILWEKIHFTLVISIMAIVILYLTGSCISWDSFERFSQKNIDCRQKTSKSYYISKQ